MEYYLKIFNCTKLFQYLHQYCARFIQTLRFTNNFLEFFTGTGKNKSENTQILSANNTNNSNNKLNNNNRAEATATEKIAKTFLAKLHTVRLKNVFLLFFISHGQLQDLNPLLLRVCHLTNMILKCLIFQVFSLEPLKGNPGTSFNTF